MTTSSHVIYTTSVTTIATSRSRARESRGHVGVDPGAEQLDVFLRPGRIAGHRPFGELRVNLRRVLTDVLIGGLIERERHRLDVLGPEQRADVLLKAHDHVRHVLTCVRAANVALARRIQRAPSPGTTSNSTSPPSYPPTLTRS